MNDEQQKLWDRWERDHDPGNLFWQPINPDSAITEVMSLDGGVQRRSINIANAPGHRRVTRFRDDVHAFLEDLDPEYVLTWNRIKKTHELGVASQQTAILFKLAWGGRW